ncbi:MAG: putative porin [Janthinobacterium sp.]|jgi:predicted porin
MLKRKKKSLIRSRCRHGIKVGTTMAGLVFALAGAGAGGVQAQTLSDPYGWPDAAALFERACDDCNDGASVVTSRKRRHHAYGMDRWTLVNLDDAQPIDPGSVFARQSYVGIVSKFGALTLSSLQLFAHLPEHRPESAGLSEQAFGRDRYAYTEKRHDIAYVTPRLHGLSAGAMYSFAESTHSNAVNRVYGATLGYARGPFTLGISRQKKSNLIGASSAAPRVDNSARDTLFSANVNFGFATAYAAYGRHAGSSNVRWSDTYPYGTLLLPTNSADSHDGLVGLAMPFGATTTLMVSHIRHDDRSLANRDAAQFAIGITHALSRQTDFFAAYARIKNNAADTNAGVGGAALNFGLRHAF